MMAPIRVPPTDPAKWRPKSRRAHHDAIPWAVYLGCNTPARLAWEWGISVASAGQMMRRADRRGEIKRGRLVRGGYRYTCQKPEGAE